jgi:hypothetical protein
MAWERAQLLERLLPPGPGVVLGIALGDPWSSVRDRYDRWFTLVEDLSRGIRQLERHDDASSIVFQAPDENIDPKAAPSDTIDRFQLDVRAAGTTDRDAVLGVYYDLRSAFHERLGFYGDDSVHAIYNLAGRTKLWMRLAFGEDSARLSIWTDVA